MQHGVIYFARSIRGDRTPGDNKINNAIVKAIKQAGFMCALDIHPPITLANPDEHIYQRDIFRLDQSHAMIVEVSNPSHGVGYEIAYARLIRKIPLLCLYHAEQYEKVRGKVSAMITGSERVDYYLDEPGMLALIAAFLKKIEGRLRL